MSHMNNEQKQKTIAERQGADKQRVLEQLQKIPIIQFACEKTGISRATYYRWRSEDAAFRKAADEASAEGEALITDMSESQLIAMIRDSKFPAVRLWLRHHHPKYAPRLEITSRPDPPEQLTPEQEKTFRKALRLAAWNDEDRKRSKL